VIQSRFVRLLVMASFSARMAPVSFMFQRNGLVKVALEKGDGFDQRLEKLVEIALDSGAEDFNQLPEGEGSQIEVEVRLSCFRDGGGLLNTLKLVQMRAIIAVEPHRRTFEGRLATGRQ